MEEKQQHFFMLSRKNQKMAEKFQMQLQQSKKKKRTNTPNTPEYTHKVHLSPGEKFVDSPQTEEFLHNIHNLRVEHQQNVEKLRQLYLEDYNENDDNYDEMTAAELDVATNAADLFSPETQFEDEGPGTAEVHIFDQSEYDVNRHSRQEILMRHASMPYDPQSYSVAFGTTTRDTHDHTLSLVNMEASKKRGMTIPEPFCFEERERLQRWPIRDRKKKQEELRKKEQILKDTKTFSANDIDNEDILKEIIPPNEIEKWRARYSAAKEKEYSKKQIVKQGTPYSLYKKDDSETKPFKANPLPKYLKKLSEKKSVYEEHILGKEHDRKEKYIEMERRLSKVREKKRKEEKEFRKSTGCSFKPHINTKVPNYRNLQRKFAQDLQCRRQNYQLTLPSPFKFSTSEKVDLGKIYLDMERDEKILRERRWPFMTTRKKIKTKPMPDFTHSEGNIKSKTTYSSDLRNAMTRHKMAEKYRDEQRENEYNDYRRLKNHRIYEKMQPFLRANLANTQISKNQEKSLRFRKQLRDQTMAYQEDLQGRLQKIEDERLFLFERFVVDNARNRVLKKADEKIGGTGLDKEEFQIKTRKNIRSFLERKAQEIENRLNKKEEEEEDESEQDGWMSSLEEQDNKEVNNENWEEEKYSKGNENDMNDDMNDDDCDDDDDDDDDDDNDINTDDDEMEQKENEEMIAGKNIASEEDNFEKSFNVQDL